jgi:hypothetical protein
MHSLERDAYLRDGSETVEKDDQSDYGVNVHGELGHGAPREDGDETIDPRNFVEQLRSRLSFVGKTCRSYLRQNR